MSNPPALIAALLLTSTCAATPAPSTSSIEAPGTPRSLREGRILGTADQVVLLEDEAVRMGGQVIPTPDRIAATVDPRGQVQVVSRGSLFLEVRRLGETAPWLEWIAPARAPSQLLWGESVAWLIHRGTNRATAHPVEPDGPKRIVAIPVSERYIDAALAPDESLWVAYADGTLHRLNLDGSNTEMARGLGPIERLAFKENVLWVLAFDGRVSRVDPATGSATQLIKLEHAALAFHPREDGSFVVLTASPTKGQVRVVVLDHAGKVHWTSADHPDRGRNLTVVGEEVWFGSPERLQHLEPVP